MSKPGNTNSRGAHRRRRGCDRTWWTHERVLAGGRRFYETFGELPTDVRDYQARQQFTGAIRNGRASNQGRDSIYPSSYAVFRYFDTLRQFWTACGYVVDRSHEDWSDIELWFVLESVGVLPRTEVARLTRRSVPAIKRKLYDLSKLDLYDHGTNSYTRWGWTISHAAKLLGVGNHTIQKYIDHGLLPVMRGCKCVYIDPGDLPSVVHEYNWAKRRHSREVETAVRRSLMLRLCFALLRYDWHRHSLFQPRPKAAPARAAKTPRKAVPPVRPPKPTHVKPGAEVRVTGDSAKGLARGRTGRVCNITWSTARRVRTKAPREGCWAARVSFAKQKKHASAKRTVTYVVPLHSLEVVRPPRRSEQPSATTRKPCHSALAATRSQPPTTSKPRAATARTRRVESPSA